MSEGVLAAIRLRSKLEIPEKPQLLIAVKLQTASTDREAGAAIAINTLALLDTGASKTAICIDLLDQIQAERYSLLEVKTANGRVPRYSRFISLSMCDGDGVIFKMFKDIEIIEYQTDVDDRYKVLLGMDLLGQFAAVKISGFELTFSV